MDKDSLGNRHHPLEFLIRNTGLYLRLYCIQLFYKRCIERATTVEAVGGSGYEPLDPATSKWVYFKGFSEETWWSVNPEPYRQEHDLSFKVYFTYFF